MMAQHMLFNRSRVIFLNIRLILIMRNLYNYFFYKHSVILFYKNKFSIYMHLVILSDVDNLKLGEILDFLFQVSLDVL